MKAVLERLDELLSKDEGVCYQSVGVARIGVKAQGEFLLGKCESCGEPFEPGEEVACAESGPPLIQWRYWHLACVGSNTVPFQ